MSSSRIQGQGAGYGGFRDQGQRRGDVTRFCRGRGAGDTVRGLFLRMENDSMGWINLEGEELLAQLPPQLSHDEPCLEHGDAVLFVIESLDPVPVLRMLPQSGVVQASALPLARQAVLYSIQRDGLDRLLRERLWSRFSRGPLAAMATDACREIFLDFLARDAEAMERYAHVQLWSESLRQGCSSGGLLLFRHVPWLCPEADSVELALLRDPAVPGGETNFLAGLSFPSILSDKDASEPQSVAGDAEPNISLRLPFSPGEDMEASNAAGTGTRGHTASRVPGGRLRLSGTSAGASFSYRLLFSSDNGARMNPDLSGLLREAGGDSARCLGIAVSPEADRELLAYILAVCAGDGTSGVRRFTKRI